MKDYQFKYDPKLMQKLSVYKLKENHCYANWCGPGAGKTNSALIASRDTNSRITVIICPNSVKQSWIDAIKEIYPNNSNIVNYHSIKDIVSFNRNVFNYILINYEKFSVDNKNQGKPMIDKLLKLNTIDFICIDEIQFAKSCNVETGSHRRECIKYFRKQAALNNPTDKLFPEYILQSKTYVYGMTATPVINNIGEVRSLIELISGKEHPEIGDTVTVQNCYQANKWLSIMGFRFIPNYGINVEHKFIDICGDDLVEQLVNTTKFLDIESILLDKKLENKQLLSEITPGTIIYCQYKKNILRKVLKKLDDLQLSYTTYSGDITEEERDINKKLFTNKKVDILVATSPISTGVNGLQEISNKLIILSYPWTGAEWDQLVGRINRQGSNFDSVKIVHCHVYIPLNDGEEWSYDKRRWSIIKNKKTLSNVVVDGKLDDIYKLNKSKFVKDIMSQLSSINDYSPKRDNIKINYVFSDEDYKRSESIINDVHQKVNTSKSSTTHNWFEKNPDKWFEYHKQREINKSKWEEDPIDVIAKFINSRNEKSNVIVDLGCGLAKLSKIVKSEYNVISVDHVAVNENIIACDIADLSSHIKNNEIDITVFCLSLWGTNYLDYIKEAYRITAKRGLMYICEPTNKFNSDELKTNIQGIGFDCIETIQRGKFTYYKFIKN